MRIVDCVKMINSFWNSEYLLKKTFISKTFGKLVKRKYVWNDKLPTSYVCKLNKNNLVNQYYASSYAKSICNKYRLHEFNFLGTGWKSWNDEEYKDHNNLYNKIAWTKDIVSGYEFSELTMNSVLISSLPEGVDIKRMWEIGRVNHLPFMAMVAINNEDVRDEIVVEIFNQIIDLMQKDQVGIGGLYYCPMDVGIRCINLLVANDIIGDIAYDKIGINLNKQDFDRFIMSNLVFLINNLEYNFVKNTTGNHFLCDIVAILWITSHYNGGKISKIYLNAKKLFYKELDRQFLENGSNYECSSCYHRLATELVAFGLIAIHIKENELILNEKISKRINGMRELLLLFLGRDENIIQIGDNDSGFVLKLYPKYVGKEENTLSIHGTLGLLDSIMGISRKNDVINEEQMINMRFADGYLGDKRINLIVNNNVKDNGVDISKADYDINTYDYHGRFIIDTVEWGKYNNTISNLEFGLVKLFYEKADIYIRTMPNYKKMDLSHAHDDVFHLEIVSENQRLFPDCGSISYTGNIKIRYLFAERDAHNTVRHSERIIKRNGVFSAQSIFGGNTIIEDKTIGILIKGNYTHLRKIRIMDNCVIIEDASDDEFEYTSPIGKYSLGYGNMMEVD